MADDMLKDMPTPTLTFDPFDEAVKEQLPTAGDENTEAAKEQQKPVFDESMLTAEERQMVDDFASKIQLDNSNQVLQYGAGAQKKIADFSESTLENVRTKDMGEIGSMLTGVVTELKKFDDAEDNKKGIFGFFKNKANQLDSLKTKYNSAEKNINQISKALESHQVQLLKDVAMLDKMYDINKAYFKELSMYILAGKKKLQKTQANDLPALIAKAEQSGLPEDAQAVRDLQAMCDRFDKKIHDLELTRMISIQMAPQIRLVQSNDTVMSEKIQSTLVNTIPLWKSQMVLALGVTHSEQAAKAQREVTDMTNELLKKNAEKLKMATIETAKESERGIVDMETLKATNASLISTLDEVIKIQEDGKQKRREAEVELNRMEGELRDKILSIRR